MKSSYLAAMALASVAALTLACSAASAHPESGDHHAAPSRYIHRSVHRGHPLMMRQRHHRRSIYSGWGGPGPNR
jgi:hypothetical protein